MESKLIPLREFKLIIANIINEKLKLLFKAYQIKNNNIIDHYFLNNWTLKSLIKMN